MGHGGLSSVITLRLQPHWNLPVELRLGDHAALLNDTSTFILGSVVAPIDETAVQGGQLEAEFDLDLL